MDSDVQFSLAVAEFGMNLSQSEFLKNRDLAECIKLASKNIGEDSLGLRKEFVELAQNVQTLGELTAK